MANMKSHIICILDTSIPSKIFKSMKDSHMFYNKHHISRVNTPNDLLGWINAGPQQDKVFMIICPKNIPDRVLLQPYLDLKIIVLK